MARHSKPNFLTPALLALSCILLGLNFIPVRIDWYGDKSHVGEKFDPSLVARARTVDQLLTVVDQQARTSGVQEGSVAYGVLLLNTVEERFQHGYSSPELSRNWLVALSGLVRKDIAAAVLPDDILSASHAACSQQSIVMMAAFRRKGIDVRKVLFPTHFALEARVGGRWVFFDPDVEPNVTEANIDGVEAIAASPNLNGIYNNVRDHDQLRDNFLKFRLGAINADPAPNASRFHRICYWLSKLLFLFPLGILAVAQRRKRRTVVVSTARVAKMQQASSLPAQSVLL
ncbi:hypothetical protein [Flaviaesturariibacter terrae]